MNKRVKFMFVILLLVLSGCRTTPFDGHSIIDWVDFIQWDGKEYDGIYSGALADESYVGEKIGTVKYKVADNVTNPSYKLRDGDAAFHEKGTEIFAIKDHPQFIAVESPRSINGYQVYYARDSVDYKWHFKDMPLEKVQRIEIYQAYTKEGNKLVSELIEADEVKDFLQLLVDSKTNSHFQPQTKNGDPIYYEMVFYTEDPIAYKYSMHFDGSAYFWHPWDTSAISDEIKMFIHED